MRSTSMRRHFLVLIAMTFACAGISTNRAEASSSVDCRIRATIEDGALRLQAIAHGHVQTSGNYVFDVAKNSPSGTSRNAQSGAFEVDADQETILTTVTLDGTAVGHYRARLTLNSKSGSISCVSP